MPELFLPLLNFLEALAYKAPAGAGKDPKPPMTPSFSNPCDEIVFRQMVDNYDLTNVLYNYEIYLTGTTVATLHKRSWVSRENSVLEYAMAASVTTEWQGFCLDRPMLSFNPSHNRKVQGFEVVSDENFEGGIGWSNKGGAVYPNRVVFWPRTADISFTGQDYEARWYIQQCSQVLHQYGQGNGVTWHAVPDLQAHSSCTVWCVRDIHSDELEWYVNGNLVVAVCIPSAKLVHPDRTVWSIPDDVELIPYCHVTNGSCKFTDIELEM